jgi:tetratricopeptide (TPR) repeat protein
MNLRLAILSLGISLTVLSSLSLAQNESQGKVNQGQGKLDEATTQKLSANTPNDLRKVIELCEEALDLGLDDANQRLAKQILAASALQRAQMLLQQAQAVAGNRNAMRRLRDQVLEDLEKAVENNPKLAEAFILLAQLEINGGSQEKAIERVTKAIELLDDKPAEKSNALVMRAVLRSDTDDQLSDLEQAIQVNPDNDQAWEAKVRLEMRLGKLQEAMEDADNRLVADETNMFALLVAVECRLGLDKTDEAIELISKSLEKDFNDDDKATMYRARARCYMSEQDNDTALKDLQAALDLNDRDTDALILRARIYLFDKQDIDKASRDVTDTLLVNPNSPDAVELRSYIAAREGRYSAAIRDMELLVRFQPENFDWIRQLSSYYQMDNRPRKAIELLDAVVKSNPEDWRTLRLRGDAKLSVSLHVEAIEDYEKAIAILEKSREVAEEQQGTDMDYSGLLNNLAWVLATSPQDDLRDGKKSIDLGLKACEVTDYKAAHILSTLAAGYAEAGDFENARKWSAKAVEIEEAEEDKDQLEQLKAELESYQQDKPWREEQKTEENRRPVTAASEVIDT